MHVKVQSAASSRPKSSRRRILGRCLLSLALATLVALGLTAGVASAQTVPTVPCADCGPGPVGDGTHAWSYTEFVCQPQRGFILQFGVGHKVGESAKFEAGIAPDSATSVPVHLVAASVAPGGHDSVLLDAPLTGLVKVRVVAIGLTSGKTLLDHTRILSCVCDTTTTTSVTTGPTTTTTVVPTSEAVTTTTPDATTTNVVTPTSAARDTTTTLHGTLPQTGSGSGGSYLGVGAVFLAAGLVALGFARRSRPTTR